MSAAPTFQAVVGSWIRKKEYVDVEKTHRRIGQVEGPGSFR